MEIPKIQVEQNFKEFRSNEDDKHTLFMADGDNTENNVGKLNPLTMEHIVQNVIKFLEIKELQTCRLINSTWEKISFPFVMKRCKVITFNQDHSTPNKRHYKLEDIDPLLKTIENSRIFPFCKFDVETDLMENPFVEMSTDQLKIMAGFYKTICSMVTELTIQLEFVTPFYIGEIEDQLIFSKLKVLNIQFRGSDKTLSGFQVIKQLIENAPILDKISFEDFQCALDEKPEAAFINLLANSNCKNISSLDICGSFNTNHVDRLSKIGLQLKSLYINFFLWNVDTKCLTKLFKSQCNSLTQLVIEHRNSLEGSEFSIKFPRMNKLSKFEYKKTFKSPKLGGLTFSDISFVNQFPVLKCLSIESNMWEHFFGSDIKPVDSVEEIVLNGRISNTDCLLHVARLFPKLKKLAVPANINVVNIIYTEITNVEELVLYTEGVDCVDDIITGLDSDKCTDVKNFQEEFKIELFETRGLSSLKKLKILRLKGANKEVELSEAACRLILMEMKLLECLDFFGRVPPKTKISDVLLREMRKRFLVLC